MNSGKEFNARAWLEIDKKKIISNFREIQKHVAPLDVMAVLKADAYGIGADFIAKLLSGHGVAAFGVVELDVAARIKDLGIPIHILGAILEEEVPIVVGEGYIAPITDIRIARLISAEAIKQGKAAPCQLKIDSGMGRVGLLLKDAFNMLDELCALPGLKIVGAYSHFPSAYQDPEFSEFQVKTFKEFIDFSKTKGLAFDFIHIANSDGIHNIASAIAPPFTMVRSGINLYGEFDIPGKRAFQIQPALCLKSRLIALKAIPKGSSVGYVRSFIAPKEMLIGTVPLGYADGVPSQIPGHGNFYIGTKKCPVVGRVSMDLTTISLEDAPEAKVGDEVLCFGQEHRISEWAQLKGCSTYEILCSLGKRIHRMLV
ncbi:MAG: alanine racemase [SAR324 cluster bacterium]|uniref:Alanine racemase n=1 Tax=SAR324 cluster bacterium TaxID=2024889 RepID=A0A7X9FSM8_9DELT|nr:alanine racemase [SAR324 cluster bacterium]